MSASTCRYTSTSGIRKKRGSSVERGDNKRKAVVLFSGGLDSTVLLALAMEKGYECYPLSFDYGQRHIVELASAEAIAKHYSLSWKVIAIDPSSFQGTSLIDPSLEPPKGRREEEILRGGIPNTYVPARNTLFLSYALGYAEVLGARAIYIGVNAMDRGGYPDCRIEYIEAFRSVAALATKQSVTGEPPEIAAPLIDCDKREIASLGRALKAPLEMSFSCYSPEPSGAPCLLCDACTLRSSALRPTE